MSWCFPLKLFCQNTWKYVIFNNSSNVFLIKSHKWNKHKINIIKNNSIRAFSTHFLWVIAIKIYHNGKINFLQNIYSADLYQIVYICNRRWKIEVPQPGLEPMVSGSTCQHFIIELSRHTDQPTTLRPAVRLLYSLCGSEWAHRFWTID